MDEKLIQQEVVETEVKEEQIVEPTPEVKEDPKPVEEPKASRNEILRELSKEYGVNLFDTEGLQEFKQMQEAKLTETERLQAQIDELKQREQELQNKNESIRLEALRVQHGIDEEKYKDFLALAEANRAEGDTTEDAFNKTLERYGDVFVTKKPRENIILGIQVDKDNSDKEVKTFDDEVLSAYYKRKGIRK